MDMRGSASRWSVQAAACFASIYFSVDCRFCRPLHQLILVLLRCHVTRWSNPAAAVSALRFIFLLRCCLFFHAYLGTRPLRRARWLCTFPPHFLYYSCKLICSSAQTRAEPSRLKTGSTCAGAARLHPGGRRCFSLAAISVDQTHCKTQFGFISACF